MVTCILQTWDFFGTKVGYKLCINVHVYGGGDMLLWKEAPSGAQQGHSQTFSLPLPSVWLFPYTPLLSFRLKNLDFESQTRLPLVYYIP